MSFRRRPTRRQLRLGATANYHNLSRRIAESFAMQSWRYYANAFWSAWHSHRNVQHLVGCPEGRQRSGRAEPFDDYANFCRAPPLPRFIISSSASFWSRWFHIRSARTSRVFWLVRSFLMVSFARRRWTSRSHSRILLVKSPVRRALGWQAIW